MWAIVCQDLDGKWTQTFYESDTCVAFKMIAHLKDHMVRDRYRVDYRYVTVYDASYEEN